MDLLEESDIDICALYVAALKDEIYVVGTQYFGESNYSILVSHRNDISEVFDVIQLPEGDPLSLTSCNEYNCLLLLNRKQWWQVSVSRITRDDNHQFCVSPVISYLYLPNPTLSVAANGDLILSKRRGENRAVISVYNAAGFLQHEMSVSTNIFRLRQIVPKSNGNLVLLSCERG